LRRGFDDVWSDALLQPGPRQDLEEHRGRGPRSLQPRHPGLAGGAPQDPRSSLCRSAERRGLPGSGREVVQSVHFREGRMLHRRDFLRAGMLAGMGALAAPMLNFGRFRLFADQRTEYSFRAIDLVARSLVVDMLGLLTLDWPQLDLWQREPRSFGAADF